MIHSSMEALLAPEPFNSSAQKGAVLVAAEVATGSPGSLWVGIDVLWRLVDVVLIHHCSVTLWYYGYPASDV